MSILHLWETRGRRFKSSRSDQITSLIHWAFPKRFCPQLPGSTADRIIEEPQAVHSGLGLCLSSISSVRQVRQQANLLRQASSDRPGTLPVLCDRTQRTRTGANHTPVVRAQSAPAPCGTGSTGTQCSSEAKRNRVVYRLAWDAVDQAGARRAQSPVDA
jgi:hypothetical protein